MPVPREVEFYFDRFGFCGPKIAASPSEDLGLVVVVPCHDEPDPVAAIESLRRCDPPGGSVEVIVVVNAAESASDDVLGRNAASASALREFAESANDRSWQLHVIECPALPRKHAGVGLARKIGMDEAVRRMASVGRFRDGVIVCYDADCESDANLIAAVTRHFAGNPKTPGASICFEHPLRAADGGLDKAITLYELHLRCYVQALRFAGFPFAFHTVGSSMAVRVPAYIAQGGMNRRQAGEDFYFLHKIIALGGFTEIGSTRVIPSPRASHRVPVGTGRAVGKYRETGELQTYAFESFRELKQLVDLVPKLVDAEASARGKLVERLPETLKSFLARNEFDEAVARVRNGTSSGVAFRRRFFQWFDAFRAMKYLHYARDHVRGEADVVDSAGRLLNELGIKTESCANAAESLLLQLRELDRRGFEP
jgi:hypothetical protein